MKNTIRSFPFIKFLITSFAINVATAALIALVYSNLPPIVPLLYGKPKGVEQLAPKTTLLIPPAIATIITFVNAGAIKIIIKDSFLQAVLAGISIVASILSAITILRIIFLIGSF